MHILPLIIANVLQVCNTDNSQNSQLEQHIKQNKYYIDPGEKVTL